MKKIKSFFYYIRLFLEFVILLCFLVYFIIPRYVLNLESVPKKIERYINSRLEGKRITIADIRFNSIADIQLKDVALELPADKKDELVKAGYCESLSFLLPPESSAFSDFPVEAGRFFSAFIALSNGYVSYKDVRVRQLNLNIKFFADREFLKNRDLLSLPFRSHFDMDRLEKGSAALSRVKGFFSNISGKNIMGNGTFLWNDSFCVFVVSIFPDATDIYLQTENMQAGRFSSQRIKAEGPFEGGLHIRLKGAAVESLTGALKSKAGGVIQYVDLYDIADTMPEEQKKSTYFVLDSLKNYHYEQGKISLEWKDRTLLIDCDLKGEKDGDRHIIIPLNLESLFH
jgi:hypothetical protein